ncbi:hypothetical protein PHYPO_G00208430 [Pangasianodon hypophthalmus]|uniref:Secreted protein n=1 Tax=Pangasianodon hypophthalmus TaxID=310915 RepID=A0A5N5PE07_PANHP|nr:hypothetical protein PHYPO_G00208430 [Pangasianodon hypophthalmus]
MANRWIWWLEPLLLCVLVSRAASQWPGKREHHALSRARRCSQDTCCTCRTLRNPRNACAVRGHFKHILIVFFSKV